MPEKVDVWAAVTEQIRGWNTAVQGCLASAGACEDEPPGDSLGRARNVVGEPGVQAKLETVTPCVPKACQGPWGRAI